MHSSFVQLQAQAPVNFTDAPCTKQVFSFNMLSPNSNPNTNAWAAMMQSEFSKGCIGVDTHLSLDWLTFADRSIHFNVSDRPDKRIPLFADGGYDLAFAGRSSLIIPDITEYYHSSSTIDQGSNWYNYQNTTIDVLLEAYQSDLNFDTRDVTAKKIQRMLYQDQPSMVIVEKSKTYHYRKHNELLGFSIDEALAFSTYQARDSYKSLGYANTSQAVVFGHTHQTNIYSPWARSDSSFNEIFLNAIFQGLYEKVGFDLHPQPLLAVGFPLISADKRTFNVTLNANATFTNGNGVRAEDAYDSFLRNLHPSYGSNDYWDYVTRFGNPVEINAQNYVPVDEMIKITKPGVGGELSFTFVEPYFMPYEYLKFPIVDSRVWGAWDNPFIGFDTNTYLTENYLEAIGQAGTGPFIYEVIDSSSGRVMLMRNDNYWNGDVRAASISFQFYKNKARALNDLVGGQIDILDLGSIFLFDPIEDDIAYHHIPEFRWQEMFLNMLHPVFGTGVGTPLGQEDPSRAAEAARYVRQAMSHLIPREVIIQEIVEGLGLPGVTQWIRGWQHRDNSLEPYEYSIAKAKELLARAGFDVHSAMIEELHRFPITIQLHGVLIAVFMKAVGPLLSKKHVDNKNRVK